MKGIAKHLVMKAQKVLEEEKNKKTLGVSIDEVRNEVYTQVQKINN
jgi:hypothetical protein